VVTQRKRSREEQRAETRQRIVAAMLHVARRDGFREASTTDVAKHARVSHGLVFAHFPTRDALLVDTITELGIEITNAIHALVRKGAKLRDVLRAHLECIEDDEEIYARLISELPFLPARARSAWVGVQSAISEHLSHAYEAGVAAGELERMPVHLVFNTWIGLVHHYVVHRELFAPSGSVVRKHGTTLVDHYLRLLRKSGTS
jgi:AcrR family transcriptional regulator